jgi:hypothetical protein
MGELSCDGIRVAPGSGVTERDDGGPDSGAQSLEPVGCDDAGAGGCGGVGGEGGGRVDHHRSWPAGLVVVCSVNQLITLACCLAPEPHRDVYEGDRQAWEQRQIQAKIETMIDRARDDPGTARRLLEMLTVGCRTITGFYRERQYLVGRGIPWELLPDHRELGRADLRL